MHGTHPTPSPPVPSPDLHTTALLQQILGNQSVMLIGQHEIASRLVRVETKLVNLIKHHGVDPRGIS